jgi:hypothetical protein
MFVPTSLYAAGAQTRTHDAVMRIGSEAPKRQTDSVCGIKAMPG